MAYTSNEEYAIFLSKCSEAKKAFQLELKNLMDDIERFYEIRKAERRVLFLIAWNNECRKLGKNKDLLSWIFHVFWFWLNDEDAVICFEVLHRTQYIISDMPIEDFNFIAKNVFKSITDDMRLYNDTYSRYLTYCISKRITFCHRLVKRIKKSILCWLRVSKSC